MTADLRPVFAALAITMFAGSVGNLVVSRRLSDRLRWPVVLWGFAGLAQTLGWVLFGGRGTVPEAISVLLGNGFMVLSTALDYHGIREFYGKPIRRTLVYSPVALTAERRSAVESLGRVAHVYAPNLYHHRWVGEWAAAFPSARVHAR